MGMGRVKMKMPNNAQKPPVTYINNIVIIDVDSTRSVPLFNASQKYVSV